MNLKFLLLLLLITLSFPAYSQEDKARINPYAKNLSKVQKSDEITEESLKIFARALNDFANGTYPEFKTFVERHYANSLQIKSTDTLHAHDKPPSTTTETINKKLILDNIEIAYKLYHGANVDHKVISMEISQDRKSAKFKDQTRVTNLANIAENGNPIYVDFKTMATCDNSIELSSAGIVQLMSSDCVSETFITPK